MITLESTAQGNRPMFSFFKKKPEEPDKSDINMGTVDIDERELEIDKELTRRKKEKEQKALRTAHDLKKLNKLIDRHGVSGLFYAAQGGKLDGHN